MIHATTIIKQAAVALACVVQIFTTTPEITSQTAPNLGTAASYGAFSGAGAIENTGLTVINGDLGTHSGLVTGFPPGIYTGTKNIANAATLAARNDLTLAYNSMNDATHAIMYDELLIATMGNGQVLTPKTYRRDDLTTISGDLTFDAQGNSDAVFIIKMGAALNVAARSNVKLINGAKASNIYWAVDGAVTIADSSVFRGTIVSNGAIHLNDGSTLDGRALAVVGAVTFASNVVTGPGLAPPVDNLMVVKPAAGDTVSSGMQNYQIKWSGTGIAATKTFEYSLDSGMTWKLIGTATTTGSTYNWNVPDTVSNKARVRITDANNLRGVSGVFILARSAAPGSIIVVRPSAGEVINGGYQNYLITFTAVNTTQTNTFEYSIDSGATWTMIGTATSNDQFYTWSSVPNVATTQALVRVTDSNGVTGTSGLFTITMVPSDGSIDGLVLTGLDENDNIGNNRVLGISWTYTPDIGTAVNVEYSLDYGASWVLIATVLTTEAPTTTWTTPMYNYYNPVFIRVTSTKGMTRASAPFSIGTLVSSVSIDAATNGYAVSNYPNPANNETTINVVLPTSNTVTLTIIDSRGSTVGTVVERQFDAGTYSIPFNTSTLSAGMYTYVLQAGATRVAGRMSVIK